MFPRLPLWLPAFEVLINALIIFLFARLAMRLPHYAVSAELVGLRASWRATSGQARPLAVAALMAGGGAMAGVLHSDLAG